MLECFFAHSYFLSFFFSPSFSLYPIHKSNNRTKVRQEHVPCKSPALGLARDRPISFATSPDARCCVRVSKAWHDALIDLIWHTVDINDHSSCYDVFCSFMASYGSLSWRQPEVVVGKKENTTREYAVGITRRPRLPRSRVESLLQRNIYWIRVLKVHYSSVLDPFYLPSPPPSPGATSTIASRTPGRHTYE